MNGIIERLGGVTEWLKVPLSKSGVALRLPWVRIPPPPLSGGKQNHVAVIMERCWSGRSGAPGERVYPLGYRGFESHPLRFGRIKWMIE
jgi:hypothetical protein